MEESTNPASAPRSLGMLPALPGMQRLLAAVSCALTVLFCTAFAESASGDYTDVAILSSTDMHGKSLNFYEVADQNS